MRFAFKQRRGGLRRAGALWSCAMLKMAGLAGHLTQLCFSKVVQKSLLRGRLVSGDSHSCSSRCTEGVMSICHKLESLERKGLELRNCLHKIRQ